MYSRHLHPLVRDMLGEFRIVYVTGPRQSGKTTLVRSIGAELGMRYLTLDDPATQAAAAYDPGLASHLLGLRTEARLLASPHYGALLESFLFMECAKHCEWAEEEVGLYHFRDKRKREVDIILERTDGHIVGVEVKASATVRRRDFNGLAALAEFAGAAFERGVVFYTGIQTLPFHRDGVRMHALPLARIACLTS